jgi:hypothetical protein
MQITFNIAAETLPAYLKLNQVGGALLSAMAAVKKAARGQVSFKEVSAKGQIMLGFDVLPEQYGAWWDSLGDGRYAVTFNRSKSWAPSAWYFWREMSLRTYAIHEILHIIGLYRQHPNQPTGIDHHNNDKGSVMHQFPVFRPSRTTTVFYFWP